MLVVTRQKGLKKESSDVLVMYSETVSDQFKMV